MWAFLYYGQFHGFGHIAGGSNTNQILKVKLFLYKQQSDHVNHKVEVKYCFQCDYVMYTSREGEALDRVKYCFSD